MPASPPHPSSSPINITAVVATWSSHPPLHARPILLPSCWFVALVFIALLSSTTPFATASVTVTICDSDTCDPQHCDPPRTEEQNTCFTLENEPLANSMFICGDTYVVQTAFAHPSCGIYSSRTSRVFRSNSCVPMHNYRQRFIYVTCDTNVTIPRVASNNEDCDGAGATNTPVALGSCNNIIGFTGIQFSIIPTCERGLAFIRYFAGQGCMGNHISTFHDSGACENSYMGDPVSVKYTCPIETQERVCLNIQHPGFVLAGVGLAVAIVLILPIMYCGVCCCTKCPCCECCELDLNVPIRDDHYVGMPTLREDVVQLMHVQPPLPVVPLGGATSYLSSGLVHQPTVGTAKFATISGFSSDTVRGTQFLFATTAAASVVFCLLAGMNQTLETTDRPVYMFWITFVGYASVLVTGMIPTPNIAGKRTFHIACCWSFPEKSKVAVGFHLTSAIIFLFAPAIATLVLQFGLLSESDIAYEGIIRHWVLIAFSILTVAFGTFFIFAALFLYTKYPVLTFGLEAAAFTFALITAVLTEVWSLIVCITPTFG